MSKYVPNKDAEEIAKRLIADHHDCLEEARIKYLTTDDSQPDFGGKVKLVRDPVRTLLSLDFIILIGKELWSSYSPDQCMAAVDHWLCHCSWKDGKEGEEGSYVIRRHNYEEFAEVIDRHGFWRRDLLEGNFAAAAAKQLRLPIDARKIVVRRRPEEAAKL